jgi:putative glutamine amidotransferase
MKIGLTYTGNERSHSNYVKWLESAGSVEVVRLSYEQGNLTELENCDGLVLSGGIDVHPSFYNSTKHDFPFGGEFDLNRDQFEKECFELAQQKNMPVLGICRGLQFINCLFGGDLIQDLGELNQIHKGGPDKNHNVKLDDNSLLEKIAQTPEGSVNSSHHQAIGKLGPGLKINCRAEDGTIEGIERAESGRPFLLAVQWHPERMPNLESPLSKNIRDHFLGR